MILKSYEVVNCLLTGRAQRKIVGSACQAPVWSRTLY